MESKKELGIDDVFDIIKVFKENKDYFEKNSLNIDIFSKLKSNEKKKKYSTFTYEQIYIVDRKPINALMNKINFDEFEKILNTGNDEDEINIKNKIKDFIKDIKLDNYTDDLKFYSTQKEIIEIIENNIDIIFVKESLLKAIDMKGRMYKNKEVFLCLRQGYILFYFPNEHSSFMINLSLISNNISICDSTRDKNDLQINGSPSNINNLNQKKIDDNNNEKEKEEDKKEEDEEKEDEEKEENEEDKEEKEDKENEEDKEKEKNGNFVERKVNYNQINENNNNSIINNFSDNKINNEINNIQIEAKNKLNKNLDLITNHLNYINLIYQLQPIDIKDINNINQMIVQINI